MEGGIPDVSDLEGIERIAVFKEIPISEEYCVNCGLLWPQNALICGNCGCRKFRKQVLRTEVVQEIVSIDEILHICGYYRMNRRINPPSSSSIMNEV